MFFAARFSKAFESPTTFGLVSSAPVCNVRKNFFSPVPAISSFIPYSPNVSIVPTSASIGIFACAADTPDLSTAEVIDSTLAAPYLLPAANTFVYRAAWSAPALYWFIAIVTPLTAACKSILLAVARISVCSVTSSKACLFSSNSGFAEPTSV